MDARVRALLEPKAYTKSGNASTGNKKDEQSKTAIRSGQSDTNGSSASQAPTASNRSAPIYDPRKLLDPRGARKAPKVQRQNLHMNGADQEPALPVATQPSQMASTPTQFRREDSGPKSMIEDLYGVERRTDRPAKRVKIEVNENDDRSKGKGHARTYQSTGIVGDYMRSKEDEQNEATDIKRIVDLTNIEEEESDDDLKIIKARNIRDDQEVCYGNLIANVHAHAVPIPHKQLYGDTQYVPVIKCSIVRVRSKDTVIEIQDPSGFTFGRIEPDMANVLAPLLDTLKKFRIQPYLGNRKKKPNELPHQQCSEKMVVNLILYGRRGDVERVAKILGHRNIWLKNTTMIQAGFELVNPHAERFKNIVPQMRNPSRNTLYSETRTIEEATEAVTKLFDHYANTTKPLEEMEPGPLIITQLLPHQKQALTFMLQREKPRTYGETENENSSLWRKRRKGNGLVYYEEIVTGITMREEPEEIFGGLLADVMGLGKTIEALALIASTVEDAKRHGSQKLVRQDTSEAVLLTQSKATLIVAPVSTVKNWEDQISEHIQSGALSFYVYHGGNREKNPFKLAEYDIVISTYSTIAAECSAKSQTPSPIRAIKWFRIVLDEAHTIRESRASQSQAMYSLFAERRWCLTGTPIQNRLDDLGSLTRFLRLYPYDTTMRFNQYIRSTAQSQDANYLKALRVFVDSFTLRRLRDRVDLPPRKDLIERLEFSPDEKKLHEFFKKRASVQIKELSEERKHRTVSQHHVLRAIMTLRLICDHGRELLKEDDLDAFKGNSQTDAIDVDADAEDNPPRITPRQAHETLTLLAEADLDMCRQCDRRISGDSPRIDTDATNEVRGYMLPCFDLLCADCFEVHKSFIDDLDDSQTLQCPMCQMNITAQYVPIPRTVAELLDWAPEETLNEASEAYRRGTYTGPSTKVRALLDDLNEIRDESNGLVAQGEPPVKTVVFSEFTSNLDLIERGLDDHGFGGSYVRIDGSMSLNKRKVVLDRLSKDDSVTILLASIKAAGQGLNLTAASRAFIMEPMWNPAAESQAVDRIYRIGQNRNVIVKRYQMKESIEEKIVLLQQKKQRLADVSMNQNHKLLNKKESREKTMKEILALFK